MPVETTNSLEFVLNDNESPTSEKRGCRPAWMSKDNARRAFGVLVFGMLLYVGAYAANLDYQEALQNQEIQQAQALWESFTNAQEQFGVAIAQKTEALYQALQPNVSLQQWKVTIESELYAILATHSALDNQDRQLGPYGQLYEGLYLDNDIVNDGSPNFWTDALIDSVRKIATSLHVNDPLRIRRIIRTITTHDNAASQEIDRRNSAAHLIENYFLLPSSD